MWLTRLGGHNLLHYATELGFLHVTKTLVTKCPLQ